MTTHIGLGPREQQFDASDVNYDVPDTLISRIEYQKGGNKLDLTLCDLQKIPTDAINAHFGLPRNLDLDLSHNYIQRVSSYFSIKMRHLTKLDLSRNQVRRLPDNFGELNRLMYLDVHSNLLETLPLSMGNMDRLTYLAVYDNPFRQPLANLIGSMGPNISGLATAELVVTLLQEVARSTEISNNHATKFPIDSRRSSRVHYQGASGTFRGEMSSSSDSEFEFKPDQKRRGPRTSKDGPMLRFGKALGRLAIVLAIACVVIPVLVAYLVDSSYLESMAKTHPTVDLIWNKWNYKWTHEWAWAVARFVPRNDHFVLKGPAYLELQKAAGFFGRIWGVITAPMRLFIGMIYRVLG